MVLERAGVFGHVLAVSVLLVIAAVIALCCTRRPAAAREADQARPRQIWAEVDASFARLDAGLAAIDARIAAALDETTGCPSSRDRARARERLEEVRRQRDEARRRLAELRREMRGGGGGGTICRRPRPRLHPLIIDAACRDNPLARGCM